MCPSARPYSWCLSPSNRSRSRPINVTSSFGSLQFYFFSFPSPWWLDGRRSLLLFIILCTRTAHFFSLLPSQLSGEQSITSDNKGLDLSTCIEFGSRPKIRSLEKEKRRNRQRRALSSAAGECVNPNTHILQPGRPYLLLVYVWPSS